jgi:hypothetical protein
MCAWEQFGRFAREPERRRVGVDARVTVDGTQYELASDLAGDTVVLLWGLFDDELFVEYDGQRSGPYRPVSGPIPLHRYRAFKPGKVAETADRIRALADQIGLPLATLIAALFYDLSPEKQVRFPSGEKRERDLRDLVRKRLRARAVSIASRYNHGLSAAAIAFSTARCRSSLTQAASI